MNREIKFRGISVESNNFIYGVPIISGIHAFIVTQNNRACDLGSRVESETVSQFTGLKDMNGIDIYEGDLVQIEGMFHDKLFKVWFGCGVFYIGNWNVQEFIKAFDFYKVVGNIYENPEFLQEVE